MTTTLERIRSMRAEQLALMAPEERERSELLDDLAEFRRHPRAVVRLNVQSLIWRMFAREAMRAGNYADAAKSFSCAGANDALAEIAELEEKRRAR